MKRKIIGLIAFVVVIIVGVVLWRSLGSASSDSSSDILTSGFIEARDVAIALETGGRIVDIAANEGDKVDAGVPLVKLDDSLLKAQEQQAEANIKLAQAYFEQAVVTRDGAKKDWGNALDVQRNPLELEARIIAAQGELEMAELNLIREKEIENELRVPTAEIRRDTAEKILENLENYEALGMVSIYWTNREIYPAEGELEIAELTLAYERELEEYWRVPAAVLRRDTAQKTLQNLLEIRDNPQEKL